MAESGLQIDAATAAENMLQQEGNGWYMDLASRKAEEACTNKAFLFLC